MKKILLLLLISFCALLLFACQSQEKKMTLIDNVSSISNSDAYGGLNENYFTTIDQDALTSRFEEIVKNAEGKKQKVNVDKEKPDYDILVRYENGETHGLHLVLGKTGEKSRIMYIGHEQNGFDISSEDTKILRNMFANQ